MSKNEYDWNEETFTLLGEPTIPIMKAKPVIQHLKQSTWNTVLEVIVLVLILTFGVGVLFTSGDVDREKTVSIDEP